MFLTLNKLINLYTTARYQHIIGTFVIHNRPQETKDFPHTWQCSDVAKAYQQQAADDWKTILKIRNKELVPG